MKDAVVTTRQRRMELTLSVELIFVNSEGGGFTGYGLVLLFNGVKYIIKFVVRLLDYALWIAHCDEGKRVGKGRMTVMSGGGGGK